jgi:integrase/recombinase XerC
MCSRNSNGPGTAGVQKMLDSAASTRPISLRDRCCIRLLHDLGLRRAEVVAVDLADVDLPGARLWVRRKGRLESEPRTIPEPTSVALAAWVAVRGDWEGPLFVHLDRGHDPGGRLSADGLYKMVVERGRKAGVTTTAHGLRHVSATTALDVTNGNHRAVQQHTGHRDVRTVQIYDDNRLDLAGEVARAVAATLK